jgi:hypothetical protein
MDRPHPQEGCLRLLTMGSYRWYIESTCCHHRCKPHQQPFSGLIYYVRTFHAFYLSV